MGFATQILFARQALLTPRLHHSTQHCHRLYHVTNARFSKISQRSPQMRQTLQEANDKPVTKFKQIPDHTQRSVKAHEQMDQECTNSRAKRTRTVECYETCGRTRLNLFRQAFDKLPLEQWENKVGEGADPENLGVHWELRTFQGGEDTCVVVLNRRFTDMYGNLWVDKDDEDDSDDDVDSVDEYGSDDVDSVDENGSDDDDDWEYKDKRRLCLKCLASIE
ncbi:hypothetical protein BOTCAL_0011g00080 [Botryotinia calthae]|uniref:Uncharacterized protein n=1 Tax=Botryotinia calthae TaxID=38488 RepID=A0A4Y8DG53_9HELO|nr:hypothetical protein BOTCAL_0011g00080 [Botryotinia calthae]